MQAIKYSVIVVICVSILLPNASFAQKEDNWKEQFLNKLREPSDKTNIKKSSKEIDRTQEDELVRLMKYQAEAKDPGMATLLGGVFGFGLGHYYGGNSNFGQFFTVSELVCPLIMIVGAFIREDVYEYEYSYLEDKTKKINTGETEISGTGKGLIGFGAVALVIIRIIEPYSAYRIAVEHNKKLLDKYNIDLSLSKMDKGFRLTYRF